MAPVPYHFQYEHAPSSFPKTTECPVSISQDGEEPVYQVFREQLAESVYEFHAQAYLVVSSDIGSYSRSTKGRTASTLEMAIQFAAVEGRTNLRYHEVEMQTHPGFFHYPTFSPSTGRVIFAPVDPTCDRATDVLSRHVSASYRMIVSLAEELSRLRAALVIATAMPPPPQSSVPPPDAPPVPPPPGFEIPASSSPLPGTSSGCRRETHSEWASLLATPAAPMLRRRAPSKAGPSRQRRRVAFAPKIEVNIISSDSDSGSDDEESEVFQCSCHPHH
ncbi:hypothetical protein ZWY2020_017036 [Hordeum vulgare]|nr:hypothetical protein ZWY2020_017036 [Hordeum vulgare]